METTQKNRRIKDQLFQLCIRTTAIIAASMIVFIFLFIFIRGIGVFFPSVHEVPVRFVQFITGTVWRAETMQYGVFFILVNTLVSGIFAALISFPISVLTALFIVKVAPKWLSTLLTTVIELLAAVPSVVYGVFAAGVITQAVDSVALMFGFTTFGGRSLLAVSCLLALMIFPTMTSLSIVAIKAVPKKLEEASLALGATSMQTNFKVVLLSAQSGIFAGLILGLARAFGEATAVSLVAGNKTTGPTFNPFDITRTLTSTMLSGINETTGIDYDIRFTVGIVLLLTIITTNTCIHFIKKKVGTIS